MTEHFCDDQFNDEGESAPVAVYYGKTDGQRWTRLQATDPEAAAAEAWDDCMEQEAGGAKARCAVG